MDLVSTTSDVGGTDKRQVDDINRGPAVN